MLDWMIPPQWLAQGDGEEWMNILFIVAVAVFWAVGGLIKAASARKTAQQSHRQGRQKPADGQTKETWQQRFGRKAEEIRQAAEERIREIQEQAGSRAQPGQTPEQGRPDRGRITVRSGRGGGEPVPVYERQDGGQRPQQKQRRAARPYQERQEEAKRRQEQPLATAERNLRAHTPQTQPRPDSMSDLSGEKVESPQPAYPASSLIDYSDADALKRAILHYEIIGRPLSLRDPFERDASGF